jgi:protein-L-isoaspartate(D-aspartate) O-methyltransferase
MPWPAHAAALSLALVFGCRCAGTPTGGTPSEDGPAPTTTTTMTDDRRLDDGPLAPDAGPGDTPEARRLRAILVHRIASFDQPWGDEGGWDPKVLAAMLKTPRHLFVPGADLVSAYRDAPYPIGHEQTISQPTVVALMTQALALRGGEKVLEIGTGSGYQAAVLAHLVGTLYTIEIVPELGRSAKALLARLGYDNVHVRVGDGYAGWPDQAPFDRIILTAAPPEMPAALVAQLAEGGSIVAPVGDEFQDLVRWTKRRGALHKETLGAVRFVPMVPGE